MLQEPFIKVLVLYHLINPRRENNFVETTKSKGQLVNTPHFILRVREVGDPQFQHLLKNSLIQIHFPYYRGVDRQGFDQEFPLDALADHYKGEEFGFGSDL